MRGVLLLLALGVGHALVDEAVLAEGNPHMHAHQKQPSPASCPAQALVPQTFLADALLLRKQEDTFLHAEQRTHLGEPVSVLHFKQPGRLSNLEFPFALVLLADINPAGIVEVPTPANEAKDSWFPDFSWNHWVVCSQPVGPQPARLLLPV
jgi:hypothetical protein